MKTDGIINNQKDIKIGSKNISHNVEIEKKASFIKNKIKDPTLLREVVKNLKKEDLSKEAKEIAKKLQSMVDHSNIRFVVKDPTATGASNIVIEVLNDHNQVVARIPEEVINDVHKEIVSEDAHEIPKGMIVDREVS